MEMSSKLELGLRHQQSQGLDRVRRLDCVKNEARDSIYSVGEPRSGGRPEGA